ncbi:hypothetical protein BDW69DRAFT_158667 [Aspergillus filifer]
MVACWAGLTWTGPEASPEVNQSPDVETLTDLSRSIRASKIRIDPPEDGAHGYDSRFRYRPASQLVLLRRQSNCIRIIWKL